MTTRLHLKNWFIFNLFIFFVSCKNYYSATKNDIEKIQRDTISISQTDSITYYKQYTDTSKSVVRGYAILSSGGIKFNTTDSNKNSQIDIGQSLVSPSIYNSTIYDGKYKLFGYHKVIGNTYSELQKLALTKKDTLLYILFNKDELMEYKNPIFLSNPSDSIVFTIILNPANSDRNNYTPSFTIWGLKTGKSFRFIDRYHVANSFDTFDIRESVYWQTQ